MTVEQAAALKEGDPVEVLQPNGAWEPALFRYYRGNNTGFDYLCGYTPGYSMSPHISGAFVRHTTIDKVRLPNG